MMIQTAPDIWRDPGANQHDTNVGIFAGEKSPFIIHQLTNMLILDWPPLQFNKELLLKLVLEQKINTTPVQDPLPSNKAQTSFDQIRVFRQRILEISFLWHAPYRP